MKESAGTLLFRLRDDALEVLLVHPSGAYNRRAPWGIPKGIRDPGETYEEAARRETCEETGVEPQDLEPLGYVEYTKSRKRIHCFAGPAPEDAEPRCASWEVDHAEFVSVARAAELIHPDQRELLERLTSVIAAHGSLP